MSIGDFIIDLLIERPKFTLDEQNQVIPAEEWQNLPPEVRFSKEYDPLYTTVADLHYDASNSKNLPFRDPRLMPGDLFEALQTCAKEGQNANPDEQITLLSAIIKSMQRCNHLNLVEESLQLTGISAYHLALASNPNHIDPPLTTEVSQAVQRLIVQDMKGLTQDAAITFLHVTLSDQGISEILDERLGSFIMAERIKEVPYSLGNPTPGLTYEQILAGDKPSSKGR